jgi:hypothetical protein
MSARLVEPTQKEMATAMTNSILLRRLAEAYNLLIASNRHYHANAVQGAIERIENDTKHLRRAKLRIADLQKTIDRMQGA